MTTKFATPPPETNTAWETQNSPQEIRAYLLALSRYWQENPPPSVEEETLSWLQQQQGSSAAFVIAESSRLLVEQGYFIAALSLLTVARDILLRAEDSSLWQQSAICREHAALLLQTEQYPAALELTQLAMSWYPSLDTDSSLLESSVRKEWFDLHLLHAQTLLRMNRLQPAEYVVRQLLLRWPGPVQQVLERADVLHLLGEILRQHAEWTATHHLLPEAEQCLVEALATRQRLLPSSHMKLVESLQALALLRRAQGRHDAQQRLLADASHLVETICTENHPTVAILCLDQAICALEEGQLTDTLEYCAQAIEIFQHFQLTALPSMALAHYIESAAYQVLGRQHMSEEVYLYAEEILQHYPPHTLPFQLRRLQHHNVFQVAAASFLSSQHEHAYVALQENNPQKAAYHLQLALRTDPFHEKNWQLLDMLAHRSPSWESIAPSSSHPDNEYPHSHSHPQATPEDPSPSQKVLDPAWYAIRAHLHWYKQRYEEALAYMEFLHQQYPESGLFRWVLLWLQHDDFAQYISTNQVIPFLASTLDQYPGRILSAQAQHELSSCLPGIESLLRSHPGHAEIASLASSFYRKLGYLEPALLLAKQACQLEPSWRSVVVLALSYETLQQWDDAIINYEVALSDCPNPIPILLDLADLLRRLQRWHEAIAVYRTALDYDAHHEKALPCLLYCYAVSTPSAENLQLWQNYCRHHPDNPWLFQLQQEHQP